MNVGDALEFGIVTPSSASAVAVVFVFAETSLLTLVPNQILPTPSGVPSPLSSVYLAETFDPKPE